MGWFDKRLLTYCDVGEVLQCWCWRQQFTMAGGMQLLAPRVAQGSRKCEGVQWWASFWSLSQMAYLLTSLELEEIVLTCLGFRSTNSQWQMVAMLKPFQDTSYKPISGPTTAAVQAAATVGSRASRVSWDSGLHCRTGTVYWPISLLTVLQVAWRPHSFACDDKSFLVVLLTGDCWKLSYRTFCRLSQGLWTQQRGILNCDYFWRYKYKVMYHYLSTTVIWWLQDTTPHLRTRMFSSPCRPCRWMQGQHRVFGCWTPRGRKHSRFEAEAQRQQWDTEAAQSDQKDDLSMVWLIELCWSPILQGELCRCCNVKLIQSDVWFGKPIDLDGKP